MLNILLYSSNRNYFYIKIATTPRTKNLQSMTNRTVEETWTSFNSNPWQARAAYQPSDHFSFFIPIQQQTSTKITYNSYILRGTFCTNLVWSSSDLVTWWENKREKFAASRHNSFTDNLLSSPGRPSLFFFFFRVSKSIRVLFSTGQWMNTVNVMQRLRVSKEAIIKRRFTMRRLRNGSRYFHK